MRFVFILSVISLGILLSSCDRKKKELQAIVKKWHNKEIVFPEMDMKVRGKDTVCPEIFNYKYKVLTYLDTVSCTACNAHLFDWKLFINEFQELSSDVGFIFVVYSQDYEEYVRVQKENRFNYPVFYDVEGKFARQNQLPENRLFHSFLLDSANRVVVIGDPINNTPIKNIYKKAILE